MIADADTALEVSPALIASARNMNPAGSPHNSRRSLGSRRSADDKLHVSLRDLGVQGMPLRRNSVRRHSNSLEALSERQPCGRLDAASILICIDHYGKRTLTADPATLWTRHADTPRARAVSLCSLDTFQSSRYTQRKQGIMSGAAWHAASRHSIWDRWA